MAKKDADTGAAEDVGAAGTGAEDLGASEVQEKADEAAEKGYYGETPDSTPNEAYTLKGVSEGQDTPETTRGQQQS